RPTKPGRANLVCWPLVRSLGSWQSLVYCTGLKTQRGKVVTTPNLHPSKSDTPRHHFKTPAEVRASIGATNHTAKPRDLAILLSAFSVWLSRGESQCLNRPNDKKEP